jgi:hypothetical protein
LNNAKNPEVEIEIGELKEVGKEFARLLKERLKTDVEMNGNQLTLHESSTQGLRLKDVKSSAKHALHHLGFSHDYRVLADHHVIRIVRIEKKKKHEEKEGLAPPPSQSLPYLFPS